MSDDPNFRYVERRERRSDSLESLFVKDVNEGVKRLRAVPFWRGSTLHLKGARPFGGGNAAVGLRIASFKRPDQTPHTPFCILSVQRTTYGQCRGR